MQNKPTFKPCIVGVALVLSTVNSSSYWQTKLFIMLLMDTHSIDLNLSEKMFTFMIEVPSLEALLEKKGTIFSFIARSDAVPHICLC